MADVHPRWFIVQLRFAEIHRQASRLKGISSRRKDMKSCLQYLNTSKGIKGEVSL